MLTHKMGALDWRYIVLCHFVVNHHFLLNHTHIHTHVQRSIENRIGNTLTQAHGHIEPNIYIYMCGIFEPIVSKQKNSDHDESYRVK